MFEYYRHYMEFWFLVLIVAGLLLALLVPSAAISYLFVFFSGVFAGRLIFERKSKIILPYFVIIAGFMLGYLIGIRYGNWIVALVSFLIGAVFSYNLFDRRILKDTRF